jgi:hypothetical protein
MRMDSGAYPKKQIDLPSDAKVAALEEAGFAPYEMSRYALWRSITDAGILAGAPPAELSTDEIADIVLSVCKPYRRLPPSTHDFTSGE